MSVTGPTQEVIDDLTGRVDALPMTGRRLLIAIAGPPASGKSTLAAKLVEGLNREEQRACLVPMDGFHLDNRILTARGLLARKGAPETFDAAGFVEMVRHLITTDEVIVPVFDRENDIAIAGAQCVDADIKIAVVEGNYLLMNELPWSELAPLWDLSVYLDVPMVEIEARSIQRWVDHDMTPEDAEVRARSNDIRNAVRVAESRSLADIEL